MELSLMQALTSPPNDIGFTRNPVLEVCSHAYGELATQPPPPSQVSSFEQSQPSTQLPNLAHRRSFPGMAAPTPQTGRSTKHARCSARSYDPIRGRRTGRLREGGRGRTRGTPNYKPREVQVLLDLVDEELPIASKGWKTVGAQYRDWAAVAEHPARTDRSLELKFKQVCATLSGTSDTVAHNHLAACENEEANGGRGVPTRDLPRPRDQP